MVTPALAWGRQLVPQLSLVWDATGDGRTALRATGGRRLLALGAERQFARGTSAWVDVVSGPTLLEDIGPPRSYGPRRLVGRWGLHHRSDGVALNVTHALARGAYLLRSALSWALTRDLALSSLATHDQTWTVALRARTELGRWLGFPLAADTDAFTNEGRRGVRLTLRTSY